ncbi:putative inactive ribonuclease-like protein 13 [Molossus nigricans]
MTPAVAWLLFLQIVLGQTIFMDSRLKAAIKNFRNLHMDYPKLNYPQDFQGYCNGLMAYVRGRQESWHCPIKHYVIHAPWTTIRKSCSHCDNFCENYNEYCTVTQEAFPLTICSLFPKQPPTSCLYNDTLINRRLYLLCSQKYDAIPISIIGIY